jgi:ribosomal protein L7/L12
MASVVLSGWRPGLRKIRLNALLRHSAGLTLSEAKHAVDSLLDGRSVRVEIVDPDEAAEFIRQATDAGAVCHISDEGSGPLR